MAIELNGKTLTDETKAPKARKVPQDRKVKGADAAKAEAQGRELTVTYQGIQYILPPADQWDVEVFEMAEAGSVVGATKLLFGEEQWATFKRTGENGRRTLNEMMELFQAAQADLGVTPGE